MTNNGTVTSYTYDLNNRLLQEVSGDEYTFYNYDNKGNLYSKRTDERSTAGNLTRVDTFGALKDNVNSTVEIYSYDGLNRLNEVRKGGITAQYTYNAEGIRTSKIVNGITTEFLLDGANVVAETKNGSTTNYIRGVSGIISSSIQGTNNTIKYYTSDGHGNITKLTDSSGSVVKTYTYDAFGVEQNIDSNDTNPFRYCGEYYDSEIEQIYLRARCYDPALGRFTQSDPAMAGDNWYVYCSNDPINMIDPYGEDAIILTNEYALNSKDYIGKIGEGKYLGHTAALVQDSSGKWFYFSYGQNYADYIEVPDWAMKNLSELNRYLGIYDYDYTTSTYIAGDFSESAGYFWGVADRYHKNYTDGNWDIREVKNEDYDPFRNNCLQVVLRGLDKGTLADGKTKFKDFNYYNLELVTPNLAAKNFKELFYNNAFTYEEYRKTINDQLREAKNGKNKNSWNAKRLSMLYKRERR